MEVAVASSPAPFIDPESTSTSKPTVANRKRKLASLGTSPAPSDGLADQQGNVLVSTDRAVIDERPRLSISRHPTFVPIPNSGDPCLNTTEGHAINRKLDNVAYRYVPAGLTEVGSALPCRTIESAPTHVRVSWEDRSPFIKVSQDGLTLGGEKGFRSARCNVPVQEGKWYMEVKILKGGGDGKVDNSMADGAHVRLGWGRREAPLNGPIGMDGYSYGYRDKTGEKVTLSRTKAYGQPFGTGDIIGIYISLPPRRQPDPHDPYDPAQVKRERIAIEFKGQEYFEILDYKPSQEMIDLTKVQVKAKGAAPPNNPRESPKKSAAGKTTPSAARAPKKVKPQNISRPLPTLGSESFIAFFVNGKCQGIAYQDLYDYLQLRQTPAQIAEKQKSVRHREHGPRQHAENPFDDGSLGYYPFISLYGDARVRLNPGPHFEFTPPNDIDRACLTSDTLSPQEADSKERTWRPLQDRYQEFMQQQWELDVIEEADMKKILAQQAIQDQKDAEKAALREKRAENSRKKRAKVEKDTKARSAAQRKAPAPADDSAPITVDERFGPAATGLADGVPSPAIYPVPETPVEGTPPIGLMPPALYRADRMTPMSDLYYGDSAVGTPKSGGPEEGYYYDDASSSPAPTNEMGSEPGDFDETEDDGASLRARIERNRRRTYETNREPLHYLHQETYQAAETMHYPDPSEYAHGNQSVLHRTQEAEVQYQHAYDSLNAQNRTIHSQFDPTHDSYRET